jgi:hypothetical protein
MAQAAFIKGSGIEKIIAMYYEKNPAAKGKEILELVNKDPGMKGRQISLSAVQTLLAKWHKQEKERIAAGISKDPLDRPWSIGLSLAYKIPADIVPILIRIKMLYGLTIREARWVSYLYPTLSELIDTVYPKDTSISRIGRITIIAGIYSYQEKINDIITGNVSKLISSIDTSALDDRYFIQHDISDTSLADGIIYAYLPEIAIELKNKQTGINNHAKDEYKRVFGNLKMDDLDLLKEYIENRDKGPEHSQRWDKENQNKILKIREVLSNLKPEIKEALILSYREKVTENLRESYKWEVV